MISFYLKVNFLSRLAAGMPKGAGTVCDSLLCSVVLSGCVHIYKLFWWCQDCTCEASVLIFPMCPALVHIWANTGLYQGFVPLEEGEQKQCRSVCISCCSDNVLLQYQPGAFQHNPPWKGLGALAGSSISLPSGPHSFLMQMFASANFKGIQTYWASLGSYRWLK